MLNYDVEALYNRLQALVGKQVWISESISRNRQAGHDRHFATTSTFMLTLDSVDAAISGANFHLDGIEGFSYSLSAHHIAQFYMDERSRLIIVEQFETKTERKTEIWLNTSP